ncbi:antitoxin VbhA family protein, partial [Pseudomonas helleri]
ARASAGLEGFKLSAEDEENARAYVEREITLDEFIEYSTTH